MKNRKVLFRAANKTVIRTELELPGDILNPPRLLLFREKLYYYTSSNGLDTNWYREVPDSFMIIDEETRKNNETI